jgi:hypothetical protein
MQQAVSQRIKIRCNIDTPDAIDVHTPTLTCEFSMTGVSVPAMSPTGIPCCTVIALSGECCTGCNSAHFGVGGEEPAEVVGQEDHRLAVGAGDGGGCERAAEELADSLCGDRPVLQADDPLEQQWHGRVPGALVGVVGGDERDGAVAAAGAGDDCGQHVGQLGVNTY